MSPATAAQVEPPAGERYLLLADISGYTGFMAGVEQDHGVDFSGGSRRRTPCSGDLLDAVIAGVEPEFAVVKLEGDAVFAAAPAASLDGQGDGSCEKLGTMYRAFIDSRTRAIPSSDHVCTACPAVAYLDLKAVLHRGPAVRQAVGSGSDLLGPAVTVAHRLLKNTVRDADRLPSLPVPHRRCGDRARLARSASRTARSTRTRDGSRAASWSSPSSAPSFRPCRAGCAVLQLPGVIHHVLGGSPDEELDRPGAGRPPSAL